MTISEITKETRIKLGMSQDSFGSKLGVTKMSVSFWERGVTAPDIALLLAYIANANDWRREWAIKCIDAHPDKKTISITE
jgi:DNA-binding XRE family transcriptional regulator